ncbi:LacI family DNA-binding transcriptional regulator [Phytohabitans aurantiacus]|uniref:LacI family transcriptional regulator n=1 Tax=Phytohabitans aurantiacus TaxID=3016789 RepID=A0ABQ5R5C2_9ACTN|nr:LacI family DNA-binding transcriptional regulator [Phytohabitans aurantiacus]GLI00771.1 LacI family transcriptional regulator [Phytohabitans aurantiacus]
MRRASIRQVAEAAGVSMSTVSNVLNNPDVVTVDTRRRVEDAMATVGYVRNGAARQLRGAPSVTVGCVLLDSANLFYAQVARGMEDRLADAGCMAIVCSTDVRVERETRALQMLEELGVRGVLLSPVSSRLDAAVELAGRGTPVVLVDHPGAGTRLCAVTVDDVRGGELAAEHLVAQGHRRIAYLRTEADLPSLVGRAEGLRRGLAAAGLDVPWALVGVPVPPPAGVVEAEAAVARVLAAEPRPTAVVCFNDMAAVGVMRGLHAAGVDIPGGMSVLGYDDVVFASELAPALTTIRQPTHELGRAAAELLLAEGRPGHRHKEVRFTPELVVRSSTGPPP